MCFYIIMGLLPPDYGTIYLDGDDITDLPMYRRARLGIGYLPQEASIFRGLSVESNIRAVLEVVEKSRDRREAVLEALLAEFSITWVIVSVFNGLLIPAFGLPRNGLSERSLERPPCVDAGHRRRLGLAGNRPALIRQAHMDDRLIADRKF